MSCQVRLMRKGDIDQVSEIDREAFPSMWPPVNFERELQNRLAHYIVVYDDEKTVSKPARKTSPGVFRKVRQRLFGNNPSKEEPAPAVTQYIVGFAGFWLVTDEAHMMNVAVREPYRRHGIGELMLVRLIDLALELKADFMTLEVRTSNTVAQNLYAKYGFEKVGIRHGYYSDNKEDAIIMSTESMSSASFQQRFKQLEENYYGAHQIDSSGIKC